MQVVSMLSRFKTLPRALRLLLREKKRRSPDNPYKQDFLDLTATKYGICNYAKLGMISMYLEFHGHLQTTIYDDCLVLKFT